MEKKKRKSYRLLPLSISATTIYVLSGLTWILLSDTVLELLMISKTQLTTFQVLKGWFFVLTTGVILFFLLNRYVRKIHEEEEKFRKTVEEVKDYAIYIIDTKGNIITWNQGAERLKGYTSKEIIGKHYSIFYSEEDRKKGIPDEHLKTAWEKGKCVIEGLRFRKNGSPFYALITVTPLINDGDEITGYLKIVNDITERKQFEEKLVQSQEQIRGLLEHLEYVREEERLNISREIHDELGQMLTSIKIDLSFLDKETAAISSSAEKHIKSMREKVDLLVGTVRRIASDLRPGEIEFLGLEPTVEIELLSIRDRLGLETNLTAHLNGMKITNKKASFAIYRIFQETLTNIMRHSCATKVDVNLFADEQNFNLIIEDNGKGFDLNKITQKSFGLLGMAERAAIMGGNLKIESSPGNGCKISLIIPVQKLKN